MKTIEEKETSETTTTTTTSGTTTTTGKNNMVWIVLGIVLGVFGILLLIYLVRVYLVSITGDRGLVNRQYNTSPPGTTTSTI